MSGVLAPQWLLQALTDAGAVASGARLFSYVAGGGNVPTPVYADKALTTPLANPYQFTSAGRGSFWLDPTVTYRLRLETATGTLIDERDGVEGSSDSRYVKVADLANDADPAKGAGLVGYDGTTVADALDARPLSADLANATNSAKGGALIGYKDRTVSGRLNDQISAKNYLKGDGTTEDNADLSTLLTECAGRTVFFPAGTYKFVASATIIQPASGIRLVGEGIGKTIFLFECAAATAVDGFIRIVADGFEMEDVTIQIDANTSGSGVVRFYGNTKNHTFRNVELDGTLSINGTYASFAYGIVATIDKTSQNVTWDNCHIHDFGYGLFSANALVAEQSNWTFQNCKFYRNRYDDLEFNAANASVPTWRGVKVIGCEFYDWAGDPTTGTGGFAIGTDSGQDLQIIGNRFTGYETQAIHIEDYTSKILVQGNIFKDCKVAIATYFDNSDSIVICDNVIDGRLSTTLGDDPSAYAAPPGLVAGINVGIYVLLPGGSSSSRSIRIFGNTITRCQYGIVAPINRGGYVNDNQIQNCIVAINVPVSDVSRVYSNRAVLCKYLFEASRLVAGHNTAEDCYQLFYGKSDIYYFQDGFRWIQSAFNLPASSTTGYILCVAPNRISNGKMRFFARKNGGGGYVMVASTTEYDGTTLTGTKDRELSSGAFSTSGSGLRINAGNLELVMFSGFGFNSTFNLDTDVRGAFLWS